MLSALSVAVVLVLLSSGRSIAHDYWFEADGADYVFYRGHRFSEHAGDKVVPYDPTIIRKVYCALPDGTVRDVGPPFKYPARIGGPCAAIVVDADSGYWSQTLTGTKNQPKDELFGVLRNWHAVESAKLLNTWRAYLSQPLSESLEIVCETDPFELQSGQKLRLLVMHEGKPREGVTVAYDGNPRGVTGKDGRINIRIRHDGMQRITASVDEPAADDKADKLVRSTALFLELPAGE